MLTTPDLRAAVDRLTLLEDRLTEWGQRVDFSDISRFPDSPPGEGANSLGAYPPQPGLGMSYPQAISLVYINEAQLRAIRAESRALAQINPFCIGAQRNRIDYTVGSGHKYKCAPINEDEFDTPEEANELLSDCRNVIDEFVTLNRWPVRQAETIVRLDRDGEAFRRFFIDEKEGQLHVRFIEPLCIQDVGLPGTWFGIEFKRYDNGYDMETPTAYYVKDIRALGEAVGEPVKVDASEVQHLKANVDLCSPRGLPTWYALRSHFDRAMRLLRNINSVAEVQSSIAMIRKHVGATRDIVQQALAKDAATVVGGDGGQGRPDNVKRYLPGTALDIPETVDVMFPQAGIDIGRYVAGVQAELRAIGSALAMPEYMISGDSSNANYSSTMVAEGPAVKSFERMQADIIDADLVVIRLALKVAAVAGRLPENVLDLIKVEAEPPIIKHEDRQAETESDQMLVNGKVMSRDTWAARNGLEYEDESNKIDLEVSHRPENEPMTDADAEGGGEEPGSSSGMAAGGKEQPSSSGEAPTEPAMLPESNDLHHYDGKFTGDSHTAANAATARANKPGLSAEAAKPLHLKAQQAHQAAADAAVKAGDGTAAANHRGLAAFHGSFTGDTPAAPEAMPLTDNLPVLSIPDVRQENDWECGAAVACSIGLYFGVGPKTVAEWATLLGTNVEKSTSPDAIEAAFKTLGCPVESRDGMTIADLAANVRANKITAFPGQYYMDLRDPKAAWNYGHWQGVAGVVPKLVIVQDPSLQNAEHEPGGDVPTSEADSESSGGAGGLKPIFWPEFLDRWHDEGEPGPNGEPGKKYVRFGIAVGAPSSDTTKLAESADDQARVPSGSPEGGEFAGGGGGGGAGATAAAKPAKEPPKIGRPAAAGTVKTAHGEVLHGTALSADRKVRTIVATGEKVPEHIAKLGIPPGAHEVHVNLDPKGDMLATWTDDAGRSQRKYGETHNAKAAADKWGCVNDAIAQQGKVRGEIARDQAAGKNVEEGAALALIMHTGMRPGSDHDTKAKFPSYGATTLKGEHIVQDASGNVSVHFVPGKKHGKAIDMPVSDPHVAADLVARAKKAGPGGRLFATNAAKVRAYSESKDGGKIKTKDHRTVLATQLAAEFVKNAPQPRNMAEYEKLVAGAGDHVASHLGNTRNVALKSYINPHVFAAAQAGLKGAA
jgi:DNA topoisomerase IB